jgi:predicted RNA-binding Zn-ribbon protein involved in translation (DUF1610 family)
MAVFKDKVHMRDTLGVQLTRERTEPVHPCPDCGAETRPHGEAPRETGTERICSSCKHVQPTMAEVPRIGPGDQRPRFPCSNVIKRDGKEQVCGRETKVHKAGRTGATTKRICVRPTCQKIIETAS